MTLSPSRHHPAPGLWHLPATGCATRPWKNGQGLTDEICLLPEDGTRDGFDLRISRATIAQPGPFSAFPGADRVITLIEGRGLRLDLARGSVLLEPRRPLHFDSGETPDGVPLGGPVRVFNVMAARRIWRIGAARILSAAAELPAGRGDIAVVFALDGGLVAETLDATARLAAGDTALLAADSRISPAQGAAALVVPLSPAAA